MTEVRFASLSNITGCRLLCSSLKRITVRFLLACQFHIKFPNVLKLLIFGHLRLVISVQDTSLYTSCSLNVMYDNRG